ncbi:unnamed protein product [marine sediment metagenome]|uniref:Uncharacterized protein n=1 Tax=marine sediment metagenome TaxID=412755 RepID=X1AVM1_9ZZZZ
MERQVDKINRQVQFLHAQAHDEEDTTGKNNTWLYDRAPEGYKFVLHSIDISTGSPLITNFGTLAIYDGHEYTHWLQFPGVESKEILARVCFSDQMSTYSASLNNWECKEYTIGIRSSDAENPFKVCIIVWYYLRKMSWLEKLQYAVLQPRGQRYRKGGATTVERSEELGE